MSPIEFIQEGLPDGLSTAFRLQGDFNPVAPLSGPGVLRSSFILDAHLLSTEQTERVRALLESPDTYDSHEMGGFVPRFGIRFGNGNNSVDALICLSCSWVCLFRDGTQVSTSLSDIGRERLTELWTELFPGRNACGGDDKT